MIANGNLSCKQQEKSTTKYSRMKRTHESVSLKQCRPYMKYLDFPFVKNWIFFFKNTLKGSDKSIIYPQNTVFEYTRSLVVQ